MIQWEYLVDLPPSMVGKVQKFNKIDEKIEYFAIFRFNFIVHFHFTSSVNFPFDDGQVIPIQIGICYFDHSMNVTVNIHTIETSCKQIEFGLLCIISFDSTSVGERATHWN